MPLFPNQPHEPMLRSSTLTGAYVASFSRLSRKSVRMIIDSNSSAIDVLVAQAVTAARYSQLEFDTKSREVTVVPQL